jgi:hypothetical protein
MQPVQSIAAVTTLNSAIHAHELQPVAPLPNWFGELCPGIAAKMASSNVSRWFASVVYAAPAHTLIRPNFLVMPACFRHSSS